MKKSFWFLFFLVLVSANFLVYMINTDTLKLGIKKDANLNKSENTDKSHPIRSFEAFEMIYYSVFGLVVLISVIFLIYVFVGARRKESVV